MVLSRCCRLSPQFQKSSRRAMTPQRSSCIRRANFSTPQIAATTASPSSPSIQREEHLLLPAIFPPRVKNLEISRLIQQENFYSPPTKNHTTLWSSALINPPVPSPPPAKSRKFPHPWTLYSSRQNSKAFPQVTNVYHDV